MSVMTGTGDLTLAFRRFEQAAADLERRHGALQSHVERVEARLRDTNRRLETVLDALSHGVGVIDRERRLLTANRALRRLELTDDDGRISGAPLEQMLRATPTGNRTERVTLDTTDGRRELVATVVPTGDEPGTRVLSLHDITEIRREEAEGGRRQRLEALGRMAAELAHEVRNPLGSIRLWACMLADDLADDVEHRPMVDQILASVAGLEGTVSNLLSFAAPARGAQHTLDLVAVAAEACALVEPACSVRGVRIAGPSRDTACEIHGEIEGIRQIVLNLIGNALAATDEGGSIGVDVQSGRDHAALSVVDDGRGIDPDDLPRVFDPFFSRTDGGTGLGLSIVHRTVERHGGRIGIDSSPGDGTTVRIELPRRAREE